jgi:Cu2+-exporting ATPase
VYVKEGAEILSGCVVREGAVTIEARRTGAETNMARISGFMENALREVSARERRSDRLADMLAPITLGLGAVLYEVPYR